MLRSSLFLAKQHAAFENTEIISCTFSVSKGVNTKESFT